ncbi:Hypothetical predicted protein [Cloeon dipterum]|uniref:Uncharacterized protein n=1 Tax=Cloeon dipterum TaxID=197152 RepID=A0A8S1CT02_9INSE|nr:Hypothetical predicted protein [Cloeon dipterum]
MIVASRLSKNIMRANWKYPKMAHAKYFSNGQHTSSARSEFYPYLLRNYLIQEYSSGRNDSEDMTFIVAKQGCFFAEIVFTNYSTSERTIFTSRPVFVHTQVPKDKSIIICAV